jgi:hypothetical protein
VILSVLMVLVILVVRITGRKRQPIVQEATNVSVFNYHATTVYRTDIEPQPSMQK